MASKTLLRVVEFVVWVLVVAAGVVAVTGTVGFVAGGGLVGAKVALFVVGVLLFGVGSLAIQPETPRPEAELSDLTGDRSGGEGASGNGTVIKDPFEAAHRRVSFEERETRVDAVVQRVPPLADEHLPVDERVSHETKLFAVSLVVLAVSMWLEFGLGVRA